ncbi:hypothetical protein [Pleionea sediminis]|uniref:hypothetical protein n=1 Tax=Pleionea sediminis TaxID=2569479 RepID=UPI0011858BE7|nr:hypothetical protein [Pleionea sediminis]
MNIIGKTISAIAVSLCIGASMYSPSAHAVTCSAEAAALDRAYSNYFKAVALHGYESPQARSAERAVSNAQLSYMACIMPIGN